ncbi:GNAT family N-acetyltransferase [Aliirhizobium smilacinae]|uniref:GNAT family N-acetyltransferase n=1 Tax=Aliirhizobium smilacinae TaxID=1395944 RepID=UPI003743EC31
MTIRAERPGDEGVIHELTQSAFAPMSYSSGTEGAIIRALRARGDLTLSLVAEENGEIIGHVAFSPVTIDGHYDDWFGLGPISVRADRQKQGIGRTLIREGIHELKALGANGCALVGDQAVYKGSGFVSDGQLTYEGVQDIYVQYLTLSGHAPHGVLTFSPAFATLE